MDVEDQEEELESEVAIDGTSQEGCVVFHRNDPASDTASDMWDDSALIKAYDKAIKLAYKVNGSKPVSETKKKNKKNKKKKNLALDREWKVGDHCRAVYSEDGLLYDAVVAQLLGDQRCVVQYTEYGNSEELSLKDLKPAYKRASLQKMNNRDLRSPANSGAPSSQHSDRRSSVAGSAQSYQSSPQQATHRPMSNFIPPPPPSFPESARDDEEALNSMLIAWYMSGYHTGYYQGLRDGQTRHRHH